MSVNRYTVENHPGSGLCLRGLRKTNILDCSSQDHLEVIELVDCPGIQNIEFGQKSTSTSRRIRLGGKWSGTVKIEGSITSLEYVSKDHWKSISIGESKSVIDPILRVGVNGLITNSIDEIISSQGLVDDILYFCEENTSKHIEIGSMEELPFRHLGICGPSAVESLTINCLDGGAQSIILQNLPNLKSIVLNGQTKLLETIFCPKLNSIQGQGQVLRVKSNASSSSRLRIGGIWSEVEGPEKYPTTPPTREEILTCSDIHWVHIPSLSYDIQVNWAEKFGLDITQVMEGIPIQDMIVHLAKMGDSFLEAIEDWTLWLLTPSEQYIGMRLIAALCARGIDKESIWKARDGIMSSNKKFEKIEPGDDSLQRFSRNYRAKNLRATINNWYRIQPNEIRDSIEAEKGLGMFTWAKSEDCVLPFDRIDLEIWIETGGIGMHNQELLPRHVIHEVGYSGKILTQVIHSILDLHEEEGPRARQDELLEYTVSRWTHSMSSPPPAFLAYNDELIDSVAEIICNHVEAVNPILVDKIIGEIIANAQLFTYGKIAIAAAMMQYFDDIRLQSMMMKHRSSKEIGRAEAKALHALSLAGRRAYTQGRVPPLEWPATKNWRYRYDK